MVLYHIGVALSDERAQIFDKPRLVASRGGLQRRGQAVCVAHRHKKDPAAVGVERGGLQVDLHPPKLIKAQPAEVDAPALHQILLDRADAEITVKLREAPQLLPAP